MEKTDLARTHFVIALLSFIIITSLVVTTSSSVTYTVGVRPGDRADYVVTGLPFDREALIVNTVIGTVVSLTRLTYYSNGTAIDNFTYTGDVTAGDLDVYLLPPGLQQGEQIFNGTEFYWNGTTTMTAAGVTRTVNYLFAPLSKGGWSLYTDQATGILVQLWQPHGDNWTMVSTNMWQPTDIALLVLVGGAAGVAVLIAAVALYLHKRSR